MVNRHFIRHYAEMVAAMFLGMIVLGLPVELTLGAAGSSWSELDREAPALMFSLMTLTMTVPMVAWMRHRGHGWQPSAEMAGAMIAPTIVAIALLGANVADAGALMVAEHVAMLVAMFAVMLVRPEEYSHRHVAA